MDSHFTDVCSFIRSPSSKTMGTPIEKPDLRVARALMHEPVTRLRYVLVRGQTTPSRLVSSSAARGGHRLRAGCRRPRQHTTARRRNTRYRNCRHISRRCDRFLGGVPRSSLSCAGLVAIRCPSHGVSVEHANCRLCCTFCRLRAYG